MSNDVKKPKYDLSATRQSIDEAANLEEVITSLKVDLNMKPNKQNGFVTTLYSKRTEVWCIQGMDPAGQVDLYPAFFDDKNLYQDFPDRKLVYFIPKITTFQQFGYWQLKQPWKGKAVSWHTTGRQAAITAEERWTQISSDNIAKAYILHHPKDPKVFDDVKPEWPKKFLEDHEAYLIKALENEDRIITEPDDPRLLRMIGAII
jgi:hypothetical protein